MATEDTTKATADAAAQTPETAAAATPATPEAAPAEPVKHNHTQTMLATCDELGISREFAEQTDAATLRQEIADARTLAEVRRAKQRPVAPAAQTTEQDDDEEFAIPAEVEAELEHTPHTKALIKAMGKDAIRGRKAREEVKQVRQQATQQSLEARGNAVLASIPLPQGVDRQTRDMVVWQTAAALDRSNQFPEGTTIEQAIAEAAKRCYPMVGAKAATSPPPPPAAPAKPKATPTARPTNRLAAALQSQVDHLDGNTSDDFVP